MKGSTTEAEQVGALCNTMGDQRSSSLYVGAVKTNVSHLEGAAGIAGLLKVPGLPRLEGGRGGSDLSSSSNYQTERLKKTMSSHHFLLIETASMI